MRIKKENTQKTEKTTIYCIYPNFCKENDKEYLCCHFCNNQKCEIRCKDELKECIFTTNTNPRPRRIVEEKPEEKLKTPVISYGEKPAEKCEPKKSEREVGLLALPRESLVNILKESGHEKSTKGKPDKFAPLYNDTKQQLVEKILAVENTKNKKQVRKPRTKKS